MNINSFGVVVFFLCWQLLPRSDVPAAPRLLQRIDHTTIRRLPKDVPFSLSGMAFFKGKLVTFHRSRLW